MKFELFTDAELDGLLEAIEYQRACGYHSELGPLIEEIDEVQRRRRDDPLSLDSLGPSPFTRTPG